MLVTMCVIAVAIGLMIQRETQRARREHIWIQRGRATPERRVTTAESLNEELQAMELFRRLMTEYLGRAPTMAEFDDEQRRLRCQAYANEYGHSPLSPEPTPPPSPTSVVPDQVRIPLESEYSPVTSPEPSPEPMSDEEVNREAPPASPTTIGRYYLPGGIQLSPVSDFDRSNMDPNAPPTPDQIEYATEEQYRLAYPETEAERDHAIAAAEYEQRMAALGGNPENHWSFSPLSEDEAPTPAVTRSTTRHRRSRSRSRSRSN